MSGIGSNNGWLEAAIAWEVCASLHRQYCKGKDDLFTTRQSDFVKHAENAREHISHGQAPAVAEAILFEHEDGRYAVNPDTTNDPAWHRLGPVDVSALAFAPARPTSLDAYEGAREDLSILKRRALEAERDLRSEKEITSRLVGELNAANGPAYMGEPAASQPAYGETEFGWADYRHLQDADKRLIALVVGLYGNDHQSYSDLEGLLDRASHGQAPAGVLEDAARWHWIAEYLVGPRTDLDDEIVASETVNELRKLVDADRARRVPADSVLEDAALLHYALADGGNQSMNWQDIYEDWSGEGHFIDALRTAYRLDAARKQGANHD